MISSSIIKVGAGTTLQRLYCLQRGITAKTVVTAASGEPSVRFIPSDSGVSPNPSARHLSSPLHARTYLNTSVDLKITSEAMAQSSRPGRFKVVVCRNLGPHVMPLLERRQELELVVWPEDRACDRTWLSDNIPGASGVIVMLTDKVDSELMDRAGSSLRVVSTMSVGYEHIDLRAAAKRGLKVGYTPDVLTDAVADLSVMLVLMAGRNGGIGCSLVQNGGWPNFSWSPFSLCGPQLSTTVHYPTRKVGFIGFGRIAQATLARLVPFGITHCLYASNPSSPPNLARDADLQRRHNLKTVSKVDLDELARESDVLIVLAPGGSGTYHVINEDLLRKMKKTSVLVNVSRGTLVDSEALAKALREGWIWGAGLDVVEGEPNVLKDHPLVKEPRCVIVPHIGSATLETRHDMVTYAAENLIAALLGGDMPAELDLSPYSR